MCPAPSCPPTHYRSSASPPVTIRYPFPDRHHLLCYWSAQTLGCGSPGAYRLQVGPDGGPTSAQSVAYGSVKAAILHGFREPSRSELASNSPLGLKATSITASAPLPRYGAPGGR